MIFIEHLAFFRSSSPQKYFEKYSQYKAINWQIKAIHSRSKIKKSWICEFWASKIMKSGFFPKQRTEVGFLLVFYSNSLVFQDCWWSA